MSYAWPVVISALAGIGIGALSGYKFAYWLVNKVHIYIVIAVVVICVPFTIYFSIDKTPLITQALYFIPLFGMAFVWIGSVVIEQADKQEEDRFDREGVKDRKHSSFLRGKIELEELIAERDRRKLARDHKTPATSMSDSDLKERIRKLSNKYRS